MQKTTTKQPRDNRETPKLRPTKLTHQFCGPQKRRNVFVGNSKPPNLHYPKGITIAKNAPVDVKRAFEKWKNLPFKETPIAPRKFELKGKRPEDERDAEVEYESQTGLLYRVVTSTKFLQRVLQRSFKFQLKLMLTLFPNNGANVEQAIDWFSETNLFYSATNDGRGRQYTSTTPSICDAIVGYGVKWGKHTEDRLPPEYLEMAGAEITPGLLLLAIDPKDNPLHPAGIIEIVPASDIQVENIYVLNEHPELVKKLVEKDEIKRDGIDYMEKFREFDEWEKLEEQRQKENEVRERERIERYARYKSWY